MHVVLTYKPILVDVVFEHENKQYEKAENKSAPA